MLFQIQHLVSGKTHDVHAARLIFYCDSTLHLTCELKEYVDSQGEALQVNWILQEQYNKDRNRIELLLSWRGFHSIEVT